jgi:diamine N-acetyltransferase
MQEFLIVLLFILFVLLIVLIIPVARLLRGLKIGSSDKNDVIRVDMDLISIAPISKNNIVDVKKLKVDEKQSKWVANINDSLIQASFLKNWHGYALCVGAKVVGFGSFANYEKIPGSVKIYKMIIDKDEQGRGYGKKLLDLILNEINNDDVYIDLHSDNIPAKNLYLKRFDILSDDGVTTVMKLKH